jgi:hypothetical protein
LSEIELILRDVDGGVMSPQSRDRAGSRRRNMSASAERLRRRITGALSAWSASGNEGLEHKSLCQFVDAVVLGDESVAGLAEVPARGGGGKGR